ncbi:hypothetical protein GPJ56_002310 [Histomonas meleagridis]|uniref:uncharacterized protein n=1 Tax=Histomonas meleagridis TaxID=135588 RepID=UPI003559DB1A|nr:hypothetical protein GPJ56_002310 [Histomonas meleagridis]KAH0804571.1 hypothetical protein GO595_003401 [Histomonas meleagridis]
MFVLRQSPQELQNITSLCANENCTISDLMEQSNIMDAFKKQHSTLIQFLVAHISEIIRIATGITQLTFSNAKSHCETMLITNLSTFTPRIVYSENLISTVIECLNSPVCEEPDNLSNLCLFLQFLLKVTNGAFLHKLPDGVLIFKKFLPLVEHPCVYDFLDSITTDGHPEYVKYLETNKIAPLLWQSIDASPSSKLFSLLCNVVSSVDSNSMALFDITSPSVLEKIFDYATNNDNTDLSDQSMFLLFELCSKCDEEDQDDDSMFTRVFKFVISKTNDLCNFVTNDTLFTAGKAKAIELLGGIISADFEVPKCIIECSGKLFLKMFEYPSFSILHCSATQLFEFISEGNLEEMLKEYKIKEKIVDAFDNEENDDVGIYYGHLYKITEMILNNEKEQNEETDEKWNKFVNGKYSQMKELIELRFGGPVPSRITGRTNALGEVDAYEF